MICFYQRPTPTPGARWIPYSRLAVALHRAARLVCVATVGTTLSAAPASPPAAAVPPPPTWGVDNNGIDVPGVVPLGMIDVAPAVEAPDDAPEPWSIALLGVGVLGIGLGRWRWE